MYSTTKHGHHQGETKLDQERAASMADEGGVSAAVVDAREQVALAQRSSADQVKLWALGALGLLLGAFALLRLRAR